VNPRQRRGVLLVGLSIVGAIAVFVSIVNYVADVQSRVGPMTSVLRLSADAAPFAEMTPDMVELVDLPERWSPDNALTDPVDVVGLVTNVNLPAGTVLQDGMLVEPPELEAGQREMAILVDAETGVAGKIGRGSVVDVYATFPSDEEVPAQAIIMVENARILDVGVPTSTTEADATGGFSEGQVVPVTFALSIEESLSLSYVRSFAANVSLALRAPLDNSTIGATQRTYRPDRTQVGPSSSGGVTAPGAAAPAVPTEPPAAPAIPPTTGG